LFAQSLFDEGKSQPETVPVSHTRARTGMALLHEALEKELLQQ